MQVQVHNIQAHVPGPGSTHDGVEVGPVVVDEASGFVHHARDVEYVLLEQTERVGVGQHEAGGLGGQRPAESVQIYEPTVGAGQLHHAVAGECGGGQVGAVGGVGHEDGVALVVSPILMVGADHEYAHELALRPRRRLKTDPGHAGYGQERLFQFPHEAQHTLHLVLGLVGVERSEAR
ncbi:MAG: hypothetical protein BWY79_01905 [Actinobacteria bacterium ADurb.Bin444]|nr:MAG: hypothetical protein BWY79_01905 [Actinobacteria bacterium ADurb.Bin444]